MSAFSDELRARAKALRADADVLLASGNSEVLSKDIRQQIAVVISRVGAIVLESNADLADYLQHTAVMDESMTKRKTIMEKNDAIRRASANAYRNGDWSEFDKLVKQFESDAVGNVDGGRANPGG